MSKEENKIEQEDKESAQDEQVKDQNNGHAASDDQETVEQEEGQEEVQTPDYESLEKEELIELLQQRDQELAELEDELQTTKDKHLRKVAELDNLHKRKKRERSDIKKQAKIDALEDFLPINDDLQRTLNASEGLDIDEKFLDGVKMVADKFENILKQQGVERIDATMVPFDVDKHEAMMKQPAEEDDVESNTVIQVIENGYRIGERTIRHAKVIVSE